MCREVVLLAAIAPLGACFDPPPPADGPYVESHVATYQYVAHPPPQYDLLFVVDDTAAMQPYAGRVADLATEAATTLATLDHGMANLQIAVTTNGGVLSPILADRVDWLGVHTSTFSGSLSDALVALADVGTSMSGPSQPLAAMHDALATPSSFVRPGGALAVITFTATDDASPVLDYVSFLKGMKSDPSSVIVSGIYPPSSANLDAFHHGFPNRNTTISIDSMDYSDAFEMLAQLQRSTLELPCFEAALLDIDPATPGIQPECDVRAVDDNDMEFAAVPMCAGSADPESGTCWQPQPNVNCGTDFEFRLRGSWATYRPAMRLECVTSP